MPNKKPVNDYLKKKFIHPCRYIQVSPSYSYESIPDEILNLESIYHNSTF